MTDKSAARWTLVQARRVHTLAGDPVEAFVVFGDRVVATGSTDRLSARFPIERTVVLRGVVVPGFNDAHAHPTMTAENLLHVDCSPEAVPDEDALSAALRAEAGGTSPDGWVVGSRYDHAKTTGARCLTFRRCSSTWRRTGASSTAGAWSRPGWTTTPLTPPAARSAATMTAG